MADNDNREAEKAFLKLLGEATINCFAHASSYADVCEDDGISRTKMLMGIGIGIAMSAAVNARKHGMPADDVAKLLAHCQQHLDIEIEGLAGIAKKSAH